MEVAVCYYGLTRSVKLCHSSHKEKVFQVLDKLGYNYDIFMHTWELSGETQRVHHNTLNVPVDYEEYQLLNPKYFKRDCQDEFLGSFDINVYTEDNRKRGEWNPILTLNLLCGLESLRRVYTMVEESEKKYDKIIIIRPDLYLKTELSFDSICSFLEKNERGIVIPSFDHWGGRNDKFAVMNFSHAKSYCTRIHGLLDYRELAGKIQSEAYMGYVIHTHYRDLHLTYFRYVQVRPGQTMESVTELLKALKS